MSRRSSPGRVRSDRTVRKRKNVFRVNKGENKPVSVRQQIHPAELFRNGSVDRLLDSRFGMNARHNAALRLGETVGNRNLQRHLDKPSTSDAGGVQQSVIQRGITDWLKKKIGMDPEEAYREMDWGLDKASTILGFAASEATHDPALRKKLLKIRNEVDNLRSKSSGIVKVLDVWSMVRKVWAFGEALNGIPYDVFSDPKKAAEAFGKAFSTAGELGLLLPPGPWTPYFMFLKGFTTFFDDMRRKFDAVLRSTVTKEETDLMFPPPSPPRR